MVDWCHGAVSFDLQSFCMIDILQKKNRFSFFLQPSVFAQKGFDFCPNRDDAKKIVTPLFLYTSVD